MNGISIDDIATANKTQYIHNYEHNVATYVGGELPGED